MTFWGIEVKPGKSFTHKYDKAQGKLHLSLANLGWGINLKKSVLQCNVGNKAPIILCHLCPDKSDSCQLHLEFEEEITFSVIGPRSVHLAGYYIGGRSKYNLVNDDDTESYGEDIGESDTERSSEHSENEHSENEHLDDFIDDREPEVFPSSPSLDVQDNHVDRKKKRRLLKKHMVIDSSSDSGNSFFDDEDMTLKTSEKVETGDLNILEQKNSESKNEERDVAKPTVGDDRNSKKKSKKRKIVDSIKVDTNNVNGTVLPDDQKIRNEENDFISSDDQEFLDDVGISGSGSGKNDLVIETLTPGMAGAQFAVDGNKVSIFYCGKLENGDIIDSNIGQVPFNFRLGRGRVIEGWEAGISGMRIGEKRRLIIPPSMGFGSIELEAVPSDSWLHYEIELVGIL